jgi:hypothetical protein
VEIPTGTIIMLLPGASNRDPEKFENPPSFGTIAATFVSTSRSGGVRIRAQVRCWRGLKREFPSIGSWIGWPTFASMSRRTGRPMTVPIPTTTYDPTFIMRGLSQLHVKFTPVDAVN